MMFICALWLVVLEVCYSQTQQATADASHVVHKHDL